MSTRVLERQTRTAPLGVRFWDVAAQAPVTGNLNVIAAAKDAPHVRVPAQPNFSGVYVLHDAPGLRAAANGPGDDAYWAAPPAHRDFVLQIDDRLGRFHPIAMEARLPSRGFFVPACLAASSQPAGYVPLFSTPARSVPPGVAVIHAELEAAGRPASWALVSVASMGEPLGMGVADAAGRLLLCFPFPVITPGAPSSPPSSPLDSPLAPPPESPPAMPAVTATVRLTVRHDPALADVARPDLCALFAQPLRTLYASLSPVVPLGTLDLALGTPLTLGVPGARTVYVA